MEPNTILTTEHLTAKQPALSGSDASQETIDNVTASDTAFADKFATLIHQTEFTMSNASLSSKALVTPQDNVASEGQEQLLPSNTLTEADLLLLNLPSKEQDTEALINQEVPEVTVEAGTSNTNHPLPSLGLSEQVAYAGSIEETSETPQSPNALTNKVLADVPESTPPTAPTPHVVASGTKVQTPDGSDRLTTPPVSVDVDEESVTAPRSNTSSEKSQPAFLQLNPEQNLKPKTASPEAQAQQAFTTNLSSGLSSSPNSTALSSLQAMETVESISASPALSQTQTISPSAPLISPQTPVPGSAAPQLQQVVMAIQNQPQTSSGDIEVRLDPPELGNVRIKFNFDIQGHVQAQISTTNPDTNELLRKHAEILARELTENGFEGVDVHFDQNEHPTQQDSASEKERSTSMLFTQDNTQDISTIKPADLENQYIPLGSSPRLNIIL